MLEILIYSSHPHLLIDQARTDVVLVRCGCPAGHVLAEVPVDEWADSSWQDGLADPLYMIDCKEPTHADPH